MAEMRHGSVVGFGGGVLLGAAVGVAGAWVVQATGLPGIADRSAAGSTQLVVFVAERVEAGEQLVLDDLAGIELPPEAIPADVILHPGDALGRVARDTLLAGDLVREGHLRPRGAAGVAGEVEAGRRAVTLSLSPAAAGGELARGDRVDAVLRVPILDEGGRVAGVAEEVVADLPVLAWVSEERDSDDSRVREVRWAVPVAVTLEADPDDAVRIALAAAEGQVHLLARSAAQPQEDRAQPQEDRAQPQEDRAQPPGNTAQAP